MHEDQFPTTGRCCGLCGEKEHFPAERERERERERSCTTSRHIESRQGEVHGQRGRRYVSNRHRSESAQHYRQAAHRGVRMIRETERRRRDCWNTSRIFSNEQDSRHGHWRQQQRQDELPNLRGEECCICVNCANVLAGCVVLVFVSANVWTLLVSSVCI